MKRFLLIPEVGEPLEVPGYFPVLLDSYRATTTDAVAVAWLRSAHGELIRYRIAPVPELDGWKRQAREAETMLDAIADVAGMNPTDTPLDAVKRLAEKFAVSEARLAGFEAGTNGGSENPFPEGPAQMAEHLADHAWGLHLAWKRGALEGRAQYHAERVIAEQAQRLAKLDRIERPSGEPFRVVGTEVAREALRLLLWAAGINKAGESDWPAAEAILGHVLAHRDHLAAQVQELQESNTEIVEQRRALAAMVPGADTPWSLRSVLQKLVDAADHLLGEHACDMHGYEEVMGARDSARQILAAFSDRGGTPTPFGGPHRPRRDPAEEMRERCAKTAADYAGPEADAFDVSHAIAGEIRALSLDPPEGT